MDPPMGAGAPMLPQGPKGHRVVSKKSNVDPFRSLLIEFCYLQQPCPQTDVFSIRTSLCDCQPLSATSVNSHREKQTRRQMLGSQLKKKKNSMNPKIYRNTCKQAELTAGPTMCSKAAQNLTSTSIFQNIGWLLSTRTPKEKQANLW